MRRTIALLLAAGAASLLQAGDYDGRLCVMRLPAPDCVTTTAGVVGVAPSPDRRSFVWTDQAGRDAIVGVILPSAERVELAGPAPAVKVRIASNGDAWPVALDVELRASDGATRWNWTWPRRLAASLHSIHLPQGRYELRITAEHHKPLVRPFEARKGSHDLGTVTLERVNRLTARIVARDSHLPIAGATVNDLSGAPIGAADALGRVAADLGEPRSDAVEVRAEGYGSRLIDVPKALADTNLGDIALSRGGSIAAIVKGAPDDAKLELRTAGRVITTRQLDAEHREVRFDGIEARDDYVLALRGRGPLQQLYGPPVTVAEGKTASVTLEVVPHALSITTYLGENRLARASVHFTHAGERWEATLHTDDDGQASTELWEPAKFMVWVESSELAVPYATFVETPDTAEIDLPVRVPDIRVRGRVVDSRTGSGIEGSELTLETAREDGVNSSLGTKSGADGRFEYRAVAPGRQKLSATARGYVASTPMEFALRDGDAGREVAIRLARGALRQIEVVSATGASVAGASVAEFAAGQLLHIHQTDAAGSVTVTIPQGESRLLYVIPREGSFAVARVEGSRGDGSDSAAVRVIVPSAVATLRILTMTAKRSPVPNVMLLLRYNGETVPFEALQMLTRVQGLPFLTSSAGEAMWRYLPAGRYELWPAVDKREVEAIFANVGPPPPVSLDVRAGENEAVLTFTPAEELAKPPGG